VVAAAEIVADRLRGFGERYHIPEKDLYADFREMLKRDDIDAVDVCVHNNLHAPVSIAVMKAGKHCYGEKPMSASYFDSKLMYDCAKATGVKFAVQISSVFTEQARIGKKLIEDGTLGDVYHARSAYAAYRRRPGVDAPFLFGSKDFMDKGMAGHGQLIDTGIYHLGCLLFMLGMPELKTVFGKAFHKMESPVKGLSIGVEDMAVGLAEFEGGMTLEIQEANAFNMEDVGKSYICGTKGALQYWNVDEVGGDWSMGMGLGNMLPENMRYGMRFVGEHNGMHIDCDLKPYYNQTMKKGYDPSLMMWYDNQLHWYNYLIGNLTDETRYDTPAIGLQASLLADGIVIAGEEGRSVTAEEIRQKSKSLSIWKQETPYGIFDYEAGI
jgi:predicted dehydrogenase